jgi:lactobin A/cerein 7B family class IIb bacteriocin
MTNFNGEIISLTDTEIEEVDGGITGWGIAAAVIATGAALVYIGGELHDALCNDH